jgi:small-conductance mechanosensitive channel
MNTFFAALGATLGLTMPTVSMVDDSLPSLAEVIHMSTRVSHALITTGVALGVAVVLHGGVLWSLQRLLSASHRDNELLAAARLRQSSRAALMAIGLSVADNFDRLLAMVWGALAPFAVPAITGWLIYALLQACAEVLARHAARDDAMSSRSRSTRIMVLSRTAGFVIVFVTVALMLMAVPTVRHIGTTLIASAGLLGLAVGAAAQPALKSLIAGLQIVLTEPVRIGDYVVVEGESGRLEDIRLSYVVIRTVDERRLIVPTLKILDSSFQNWTRVGGNTGNVTIPVKPGFPIAPIRAAYQEKLAQMPEWDGRTGDAVISDARVGWVEVKLVMTAEDPEKLAKLRLSMREAMLEGLRVEMPDALCVET